MAGRRLNPDEQIIWSRLAQTIRPLPGRSRPRGAGETISPQRQEMAIPARPPHPALGMKAAKNTETAPARPAPVAVLDDGWERRIATGAIIPEMSVDLHGHSLEAAHKRLNQALGAAVARGVRVLLVVTGNPRPLATTPSGQKARGAIRAEIGDWLALSGQAEAIASVRVAHPRHGGRGALYIILRRRK